MIKIVRGNLLVADAEALVNTVNCVGFMGKGIALQFKKAFPENFNAYHRACNAKKVIPGRMFVFETGTWTNPKYIINFPTKRHWRGKSKLQDIETGLGSLIEEVCNSGIASIAIPPLGCGLGGLRWNTVRLLIENSFSTLPDVRVLLFEPVGTPDARSMPIGTQKPKMTVARALFIKLMQHYSRFAYRLTLLEIQKLAYFLQESGEPLRLKYEAGIYGPYAHNLNKVLEILEGHFIRGYGDTQKPDVEIMLLDGAVAAADRFMSGHEDKNIRLGKVAELIEGFETPYGMELLSSVHWVVHHGEKPISTEDQAIQAVYNWNNRKRNMLKEAHLRIAWRRLSEKGLQPMEA